METDIRSLATLVLTGVFLLLLLVFIFHSLFLGYHWLNYGTEKRVAHKAIMLYLIGGAILFLGMGVLIFRM